MDCPRLRYEALADAAAAELAERGLQVLEHQVDKVVQLHEARAPLLTPGYTGHATRTLSITCRHATHAACRHAADSHLREGMH